MKKETMQQQLNKVMRVSSVMKLLLQIAQAFAGIGIAMMLIALTFSDSFQLNLGNGDLGITFFQQEQATAVLNFYDARDRFGPNLETGLPAAAQALQLETTPTPMLRVISGALLFAQLSVVMLVLEYLARLFGQYEKGEIFSRAAVANIRNIGYTLFGLPVLALLNSLFAMTLVASVAEPGKAIPVQLSIQPFALYAAVVVLLISWIMDVGRALREENELTI